MRSGHKNVVGSGGRVTFEVEVADCADIRGGAVGIAITNDRGARVAFFHTLYQGNFTFTGVDHGKFTCTVPSLPLVANTYFIELVFADGYGVIEKVERADRLDVVYADVLGTGKIPSNRQGYVVWPSEWEYTGPAGERDGDGGSGLIQQQSRAVSARTMRGMPCSSSRCCQEA